MVTAEHQLCSIVATKELVARRAIKAIEGKDVEDVSEYLDHTTEKYQKMVDWIRKDMEVTTLKYQKLEDMIEATGMPKEKLCLHCWTGECPPSCACSSKKQAKEAQAV